MPEESRPSPIRSATRAGPVLWASLAMIGSSACWGFATVMSRDLLDHLPPTTLLVIQLTASVLSLCLLSVKDLPRQRFDASLLRASLTGALEPGLAYVVGLAGLRLTTAGKASVIGATEPIIIVILAWLLLKERPSRRLAACIALAVTGLVLVSWSDLSALGGGSLLGDGLIVLATVFAAGYVVASSRLAQKHQAAPLAAAQQIVGLLVALIACGAAHRLGSASPGVSAALGVVKRPWEGLETRLVLYAMLSGVVQYAAAFWLYLIGLRHLPPTIAALWLTLIPVFGLAGSIVWLGERPPWPVFVGAALIIAAVATARGHDS